MRDGPGRRAAKRLALWNFQANLAIQRAAQRRRGHEYFVLGGDCRRCAQCCEAPGIQVGRLVWHVGVLRAVFLWWQRHVNGFALTEVQREARTFVFRCTHFDAQTRACDSYDSRPGMCRDYPRLLMFQPSPEMMPACGYRPVAKNAAAMTEALLAQNLPEEQLVKLRKGLHLE